MKSPKHRLSFNKLSDTEFEEFIYDLLEELNFVNLDWRKGTGKKTRAHLTADETSSLTCIALM